MTNAKTQNVSMKLCQHDVERVKTIARRLRVRESDVIRFALRLAFTKLAPLHNQNARGRDLIPVFLECGPELAYHFDLDSRTLESIINGDASNPQERVDPRDIEILAVSHLMPGNRTHAKHDAAPKLAAKRLGLSGDLQKYLHEKYIEHGHTEQKVYKVSVSSLQVPL
jgi:hypothetical protein